MVLCLFLGLASVCRAEPDSRAIASSDLVALVLRAKNLAAASFPDIPTKNLSGGYVSVFHASRMSALPDGVMVSFPIRGSHRTEKLGEMEDRIIVILHDDAAKKPDVKRVSRWLYEDSIALTEY